MKKILLARKYKSKNPFTKYMEKNIEEHFYIYHEDWKKFEQVKTKLKNDGYTVWVFEVKEDAEING